MATAISDGNSTILIQPESDPTINQENVLRLKLSKPESQKKVNWTNETIDNENMGKKKSKCCCVYAKSHSFDVSSSEESDDECEHCTGHVERKKKKKNENINKEEENTKP